MTIRAALVMALIAVGVIATTPCHNTGYVDAANWTVTDLPSHPNSATFKLKAGKPGTVEVFRVDKHGRITVNVKEWNRR